jgi:hypothetical protein
MFTHMSRAMDSVLMGTGSPPVLNLLIGAHANGPHKRHNSRLLRFATNRGTHPTPRLSMTITRIVLFYVSGVVMRVASLQIQRARKSRIAAAITLAWVSSAKWPVSKKWITASGMSRLNASAPRDRKKGSFFPHVARKRGSCVRK